MTLLFKLELVFLDVFFAPRRVYGGSDSIPLVPLRFPASGPGLVYSENLSGLSLSSVGVQKV